MLISDFVSEVKEGDLVRITKGTWRNDYNGMVCVVVSFAEDILTRAGRPSVLLAPMTNRPDGFELSNFNWPIDSVEPVNPRGTRKFTDNTRGVAIATGNAYQFEILRSDLIRRRKSLYTVGEFAGKLGVKKKWVRKFESNDSPRLFDLKYYALGVEAVLEVSISWTPEV